MMTKPSYSWCPVGKCACAKKVGDTCTFGNKVRLLAMMKKCADKGERKE
jgi:hypothetical protein